MIMDLNYRHLEYFWATAHDGNLTRTAERLNVSQSALSVQIKKLEERLGSALFERRGRTLHLTEVGRIALDYADTIFAAGNEMLGVLQNAERPRELIRVGSMATLSRNFQIEFLRPLRERSNVEIVLRSGSTMELLRGLESLNLDIVLLNQPPPKDTMSPFISHRLAEWRVSLMGSKAHRKSASSLEELLREQPVLLPTTDSNIRLGFDSLVSRLSITPIIAAEVDDMAMLRLLAREGIGMAVIPPIVVRDELKAGQLFELTTLPDIAETFYAVTLQRRFPNRLVEELLQSRDFGPAEF